MDLNYIEEQIIEQTQTPEEEALVKAHFVVCLGNPNINKCRQVTLPNGSRSVTINLHRGA